MSQSDHQLELFSDPQEDPKAAASRAQKNSFLTRIWGYEKTVLIILALLVTAIVAFSLGVEKGKRTFVRQSPAIASKPAVAAEAVNRAEPLAATPAVPELKPVAVAQKGDYTIQVASFKAAAYAKKEAVLLKKRGFESLILKSGSFTILCVGRFPDKETAQPLLKELRKYYKSCYIRRL